MLLAHAVVPHHCYENSRICFDDCHRNDAKDADNHEYNNSQQHQHDENALSDSCMIDDNYTPANNNIKKACRLHHHCDCGNDLYTLLSNHVNIHDCTADETGLPFRQNPSTLLFYSEFISQSIGLRAPPAC
jgi:hypothetical protein